MINYSYKIYLTNFTLIIITKPTHKSSRAIKNLKKTKAQLLFLVIVNPNPRNRKKVMNKNDNCEEI